jgi:hypothetical protein
LQKRGDEVKLMVTEDGPNGEPQRPTEKVCCVRGIPAGAIFDVVDCDVIVLALVAVKAMRSRYLRSAQVAEIFLQLEALNGAIWTMGNRPFQVAGASALFDRSGLLLALDGFFFCSIVRGTKKRYNISYAKVYENMANLVGRGGPLDRTTPHDPLFEPHYSFPLSDEFDVLLTGSPHPLHRIQRMVTEATRAACSTTPLFVPPLADSTRARQAVRWPTADLHPPRPE